MDDLPAVERDFSDDRHTEAVANLLHNCALAVAQGVDLNAVWPLVNGLVVLQQGAATL